MSNLINITRGKFNAKVLPSNYVGVIGALDKVSKGKSPRKKQPAQTRVFPSSKVDLRSTKRYVKAYYRLNSDLDAGTSNVEDLFQNLNTAPTTWPEGEDVVHEIIEVKS